MKRLFFLCASVLMLNAFGWRPVDSRIQGLEEEHSVLCAKTIRHGTPILHLSLRNTLNVARTFELETRITRCAPAVRSVTLAPFGSVKVSFPLLFVSEYDRNWYQRDILLKEPYPPKGVKSQPPGEYVRINFGDVFDFADAYGSHSENESLLLASSISYEQLQKTFSEARGIKDAKGKLETFTFHAAAAPEILNEWPRDYRAYLTFDAVLAPPSVFDALPAEVRQALAAYERLGGSLIKTEEDVAGGFSAASAANDAISRFQESRRLLVGDCKLKSYGHPSNTRDNLERIPIRVGTTLPAGFIILLLAIFSFVFVPFIVWLCANKNKRILVLVILPGAAFSLAVLVGIIALVTFGTTPTVRLQSVTLLDQTTRLAVTRGQFAVFAPGNTDGELSIPSDATLAIRDTNGENFAGSITYDDAIRLKGKWIPPLTATFFDFTRASQRAEKLDVRLGTNGTVTVANLLGVPVTEGCLRHGHAYYTIPALQPGEKAELASRSHTTGDVNKWDYELFSDHTDYGRHWGKINLVLDRGHIPNNSYYLKTASSPFFPNPFGERETKSSIASIILGTYAEETK